MLKLLRFNKNGHLRELPAAMHAASFESQPRVLDRSALEALIESEERFRLAADAAGIGTWDWDIASGRVRLSERTYALHGVGITFGGTYDAYLELIHADDRERFANGVVHAIQEKADLDAEDRILL